MRESNKFENRTVVVTGGAGVLGQGVVGWFSDRGAKVAVLDISDEVLAGAYPDPAQNHCYIACDLTSREGSEEAVGKVLRQFGEINILCNIAGGVLNSRFVQAAIAEAMDTYANTCLPQGADRRCLVHYGQGAD